MHFDPSIKLSEVLQLVGAATAFAIALWQYVRAQSWKRAEFVANEVRAFVSDAAVVKVMTMLDWGSREIELGERGEDGNPKKTLVTYQLVSSALMTHEEHGGFSGKEAAIRDCFDRFLEYLERFEAFIEAGLVRPRDFSPYLHYWTTLLAGEYGGIPQSDVLPRFWKFVDSYGYKGVRRLISRYHSMLSSRYPTAPN
jgi:hypothetical protein